MVYLRADISPYASRQNYGWCVRGAGTLQRQPRCNPARLPARACSYPATPATLALLSTFYYLHSRFTAPATSTAARPHGLGVVTRGSAAATCYASARSPPCRDFAHSPSTNKIPFSRPQAAHIRCLLQTRRSRSGITCFSDISGPTRWRRHTRTCHVRAALPLLRTYARLWISDARGVGTTTGGRPVPPVYPTYRLSPCNNLTLPLRYCVGIRPPLSLSALNSRYFAASRIQARTLCNIHGGTHALLADAFFSHLELLFSGVAHFITGRDARTVTKRQQTTVVGDRDIT